MTNDRIIALALLALGAGGTVFVLFQRVKITTKLLVAALWFVGAGVLSNGYSRFLAHDITIQGGGRYPSAWWQDIFTGVAMLIAAIMFLRSTDSK